MAKEYTPGDLGMIVEAFSARLDTLEEASLPAIRKDADDLRGKLTQTANANQAIGQNLARLSKRIDKLAGVLFPEGVPGEAEKKKPTPARNWLTVDDPRLAEEYLADVQWFLDDVYRHLPLTKDVPECWPWHAAAVVEFLALADQYAEAYTDGSPNTLRSDFVSRWVPAARSALESSYLLGECGPGSHHDKNRGRTKVDPKNSDARREFAAWWATNRDEPENMPGLVEQ